MKRASEEVSKVSSAHVLYRQLVAKHRYIYHVVTVERWRAILLGERALRSRNELGSRAENYALPALVALRGKVPLGPSFSANDAVPFYLTPRTPMFCRMVREGRVRREEVIAIGFDFEQLHNKYEHWLFSSNPAYVGSALLGTWRECERVDWAILEAWDWSREGIEEHEQLRWTFSRQAELLVMPPVAIADADHIIVDMESTSFMAGTVGLKVIEVPGVFA
jgi:hypothetical protein